MTPTSNTAWRCPRRVDTIGGLVMDLAGACPTWALSFDEALRLTVLRLDGRRVEEVLVQRS